MTTPSTDDVIRALVRRAIGFQQPGDRDILWSFILTEKPREVRCACCHRTFSTPQGLGQHHRHAKHKPSLCRRQR